MSNFLNLDKTKINDFYNEIINAKKEIVISISNDEKISHLYKSANLSLIYLYWKQIIFQFLLRIDKNHLIYKITL